MSVIWGTTDRPMTSENPPNPKQRYGDLKAPLGLMPSSALFCMAQALKNGAAKYGQYNWRETKVETMTYIHACLRHVYSYLDGEAIDPESGASHLGHAMACLAILADAEANDGLIDNRPKPGCIGQILRDAAVPG